MSLHFHIRIALSDIREACVLIVALTLVHSAYLSNGFFAAILERSVSFGN